MALKLHGGASLAVLALTQFNFCSRGHKKYVSTTPPSLGGLRAPCPRAITAVIDTRKKIDGDHHQSQKINFGLSGTCCRLASSPPT